MNLLLVAVCLFFCSEVLQTLWNWNWCA